MTLCNLVGDYRHLLPPSSGYNSLNIHPVRVRDLKSNYIQLCCTCSCISYYRISVTNKSLEHLAVSTKAALRVNSVLGLLITVLFSSIARSSVEVLTN
jgi:hypothetical protein